MKRGMKELAEKVDSVLDRVNDIHSDVQILKKEAKKTNGRITKLETQRMEDIKIHSKFESDFANHALADEKQFTMLKETDDRIFLKLDKISAHVYVAVGIGTILAIFLPFLLERMFH